MAAELDGVERMGMGASGISVIAYAGYMGEQEPRGLVVDGARIDVIGIDDRWHDPDARYFKVAASDGRMYLLRCDAQDMSWALVRSWTLDS